MTTPVTNFYRTHIETLFSLVLVMFIVLRKTESADLLSSSSKSIYQVLESQGLPSGLFPKGITNFTISDDGCFEVYLDQPCDAKFESELHYEKNVAGNLSFGQIGNLSGVSAQDLFLWFPVKGIRVDIPSSGVIYFDVGVVRKQFSVSMFETPRECVATTHPLDSVFDAFTENLVGALRNSINWWWKNAGELF